MGSPTCLTISIAIADLSGVNISESSLFLVLKLVGISFIPASLKSLPINILITPSAFSASTIAIFFIFPWAILDLRTYIKVWFSREISPVYKP